MLYMIFYSQGIDYYPFIFTHTIHYKDGLLAMGVACNCIYIIQVKYTTELSCMVNMPNNLSK